jgi:hypothetical protein
MLNFHKLQAPAEDSGILIEPGIKQWPAALEENRNLFKQHSFTLAGQPVEQVRRETRKTLFGTEPDQPVLATGHQPAFIHPGVWAKYLVVRRLAEQQGYQPLNLVVDNDALRSSALQVPVLREGGFQLEEVPFFENADGIAYEGQQPLSTEALRHIREKTLELLPGELNETAIETFLDGCGKKDKPVDAIDQYISGRAKLDEQLTAKLPDMRVNRAFGGPFAAEILLNAKSFADCYNRALADYRQKENVRSENRPVPDLQQENGRIETPLWIYQPGAVRRALWVEAHGNELTIFAGSDEAGRISIEQLKDGPQQAMEQLSPWLVRPRALTLTMWARLLVCDFFVHGIGGAKYDRITDAIIERYFGSQPPAYACVTATLRLPLEQYPVSEEDLRRARWKKRDIQYNPDRYVSNPPADMLDERQRLINRSRELRKNQGSKRERHQVFKSIREINQHIRGSDPETEKKINEAYERIANELESNRIAGWREYFYALYPHSRLQTFAENLNQASGC